jgi:hypothetical protein
VVAVLADGLDQLVPSGTATAGLVDRSGDSPDLQRLVLDPADEFQCGVLAGEFGVELGVDPVPGG